MFELHITCSKDIDNLAINFSDGTSVITESSKEIKEPKIKEVNEPRVPKEPRKKLDTYLDTEDDYEMTQEVVQKPIIQDVQRPAKVSDELQNLDI